MNRVEKREPGPGKGRPRIKNEGAKLIVMRAKDILQRMEAHARDKFGKKDRMELLRLEGEISEALMDSDSRSLDKREETPLWTSIMSKKGDPCEMGDIYTLREALDDCLLYVRGRLKE